MSTVQLHFAPESLACTRSQPQAMRATSAAFGWTSVLLDDLEGAGRSGIFEPQVTPDLGIVVAIAGSHRLEAFHGGAWHSSLYQPRAAGLTAGGEANRLRWEAMGGRSTFRTAHLYIPAALVAETAEDYRRIGAKQSDRPLNALIFNDPLVADTVAAMLIGLREQAPDLYAEAAARWLVTYLLSHHARWWDPVQDRRSIGMVEDRRLARSLDYLSANLARPLSLGELAREAGISVHHFGRLFRARIGATPHAYLTRLRLECAERMLLTTDLPVAEIAAHCGYASAAAFATAFARTHRVPPARFRQRRERPIL